MDWFYVSNQQKCGPVPEAQIDDLMRAGTIHGDTLVWHEGLADWQPLRLLRPAAPPPLPPQMPPIIPQDQFATCIECQRSFSQDNMVRLNHSWVCAECKPPLSPAPA